MTVIQFSLRGWRVSYHSTVRPFSSQQRHGAIENGMSDKPAKSPGTSTRGDRLKIQRRRSEPGRLDEDDRGNMTWQWADNDVLQADNTPGAVERLRALVDPAPRCRR